MTPLGQRRQLAAHEQQLLARLGELVAQQAAQVGEALPFVAGHLAQQRPLAMHHLVVRQRQHEVLGVHVQPAEGEPVVVVAPMDRVLVEIGQRVVHPAHVPLETEAQAAQVGGARDAREGGRLFGNGHDPRMQAVRPFVDLAQEGDRLQVLVAAVLVRLPLAGLARVVQVEHRGHGIHPQPVDVVAVQPEQGVGDQEVAHLGAPEVEDERAPVRVRATARIGVLVERRAVELAQGELVVGEVGRHPVDDHPDSRVVQRVDHGAEVIRGAEAGGRRVVAGDLVAPRAVERMLGHRQQLDVGEAEPMAVLRQLLGGLPVSEPAAVRVAPPGAKVDLVDRHR